MSPRGAALGLVFVACWGAAACLDESPTSAPPRAFAVELHNERPVSAMRSQPAGQHTWSGDREDTVAIQMTAPVTARSVVVPAATLDGALPSEVAVFLDGAGQLGDLGKQLDSSLTFLEEVLPSRYDVLVAPDALLGRHPARFITPVTFQADVPAGSPLDWTLPPMQEVTGQVTFWNTDDPVGGAVVTVYRATEPRLPAGVTTVTDASGAFRFEVPEGTYDIVVAGPSDGSVPIPPVRLLDQRLPLFPGLTLRAEVPVVPVIPVRGRLVRAGSEVTVPGRLRLTGRLEDLLGGATGILMGRYQVEIETEADGSFEIDLPLGTYEALAIPRYLPDRFQNQGLGRRSFPVPFGVPSVEGLDITMETPVLLRVETFQPGGAPMLGATLVLRMRDVPRYAWSHVTGLEGDLEGAFLGTVIPGEYDIELIPPPDADGNPRLARVQTRASLLADSVQQITTRRSDKLQGLVFTEGEQPVGDVRVFLRDPETGKLWDTAITRREQLYQGVFEAVVPR
jgi:hypothetical protein